MRVTDRIKPPQGHKHDQACSYLKEQACRLLQRVKPRDGGYASATGFLEVPIGHKGGYLDLVVMGVSVQEQVWAQQRTDRDRARFGDDILAIEPCMTIVPVEVKVVHESLGVVLRQLKWYRALLNEAIREPWKWEPLVLAHSYAMTNGEQTDIRDEGFQVLQFTFPPAAAVNLTH
jgi:hypothetical protein